MLFNASDSGPRNVSSLPASGTALTANTIYNVSSPVGTYVFTPPASGWAHGTFSTAASVAVSFVSGANYLGEAPAIEASKTYEFDVYNGVWAVQTATYPAWGDIEDGTVIEVDTIVTYNGKTWQCTEQHIKSTVYKPKAGSTKWTEIAS